MFEIFVPFLLLFLLVFKIKPEKVFKFSLSTYLLVFFFLWMKWVENWEPEKNAWQYTICLVKKFVHISHKMKMCNMCLNINIVFDCIFCTSNMWLITVIICSTVVNEKKIGLKIEANQNKGWGKKLISFGENFMVKLSKTKHSVETEYISLNQHFCRSLTSIGQNTLFKSRMWIDYYDTSIIVFM